MNKLLRLLLQWIDKSHINFNVSPQLRERNSPLFPNISVKQLLQSNRSCETAKIIPNTVMWSYVETRVIPSVCDTWQLVAIGHGRTGLTVNIRDRFPLQAFCFAALNSQ